jgi:hypothetical protein
MEREAWHNKAFNQTRIKTDLIFCNAGCPRWLRQALDAYSKIMTGNDS